MKKQLEHCLGLAMLCLMAFLVSSCMSTGQQEYQAYRKLFNNTQDDSGYNMKIKNCRFPDGRRTDAYVFDSGEKATAWQDGQVYKLKYNGSSGSSLDVYFKEAFKTAPKAAEPNLLTTLFPFLAKPAKGIEINPVSYFTIEDAEKAFPDISESGFTFTSDTCVIATYEDTGNVYLLMLSPMETIGLGVDKNSQKLHEGQLGYKVAHIAKKTFEPKRIDVPPAKVTPFDPSLIPDSDWNIMPGEKSSSVPYYAQGSIAAQLQWLAVKTACMCKYDMAYAGDFSTPNPEDCYTTSTIKPYLAQRGNTTRGTMTCEGICFDYAAWAVDRELKNGNYSGISRWWMVGTHNNPNQIALYRIANKGERYSAIMNGTPVVDFEYQLVRAHGNATTHAWVWVQANDGTIYWIDPTWTDNTGRPVYGVVRNGQEIQLSPDHDYCVR
ncbi:MAG: hypothetical protein K2H09_03755 [Treponemataceae bacterium]|nr:hypothetical protein [Treponemataceae bacterium]